MSVKEDLFPTIGASAERTGAGEDDEGSVVQQIDSLCMECHEQGVTRLLLTKIPFFQEVVVMSFRCEHCGATNNEIQSAGTIRKEGAVYTARILDRSDLDRQIVRSPTCEVVISEYQLTLPPCARGQLTTVEGLIRDVIADLSMDQPLRRIQDPEGHAALQGIIEKLQEIIGKDEFDEDVEETTITKASTKDLPMPAFTVKLDDPSGNSFIEFRDSMSDPKWNMRTYSRTFEQNVQLGLVSADDAEEPKDENDKPDDEIFTFHSPCSSCGHPTETNMKKTNIPYFKDVLIMATSCDRCGYRDNEVKSGGAISEQGKRIILKVEDSEDLSRDILKSETGGLRIPEIDLVLTHGTLGGRFTTLEGILNQVYEELSEKVFTGDSAETDERLKFETFLKQLKEVKNAERPFTLIVDDPMANSYVQNLYAPDPDPNMTVEMYDRTWEQNEELGLNDIKVEGYEEPEKEKETPAES
ncbi:zf-ZPR1-domain-containing protein [Cylindrobasidium torrendii FP15055 ss-10]|uniref:Zf-ZPR1-domain-containing protein n=1 Tax=Cylindrobasidium torrendii FP15055 ss-10 TaxID=1314674 RepID=A0A0D7B7F9_9AGAR|nr:zf-ZPR1-domain-containing protein [Cylindrobasidium torrendii FP15055 ss-10]